MRLYTRTGATALDHPVYGHFEADELGGFDFPNELSDQLHGFAVRGAPLWETDIERQRRLIQEEMERRRDPASLYEAVAQIMNAAKSLPAPAVAAAVPPEAEAPLAPEDPAPAEPADVPAPVAKKRAPAKRAAAARGAE